ncbi:MAG TPA: TlpA disulfide reductase family protein [Vicinamibacterales bacterium]|jgi:thiol-disulfide isomerase/thioredoxin|nr:TlpA disulfide reductase family protein [Vicinamibacterales bacterium]
MRRALQCFPLTRVLAAGLVLAMGAAACSKRGDAPASAESTAESTDPAPATVDVVQLYKNPEALPAFVMTDLEGRRIASTDLRGKVVLVNFWATWCPPCRQEIPDLIKLQNKYKDKLIVIGVSEDEIPVADVKKFVTEQGMNYPIVMTNPELRKIFKGIAALPTTFILDTDGHLAQKHIGILSPARTEAETRVLAGLEVTARVERIENSDKARIESAAEAKKIPGVDLDALNETQRKAVLQALMAENCTCGCDLTVAICRLDDPSCAISLPIAQDIVKKYSAMP